VIVSLARSCSHMEASGWWGEGVRRYKLK
jgi:hypothetical protein